MGSNSETAPQASDDFESIYRSHVAATAAGDIEAAMADIDPAVIPGIFTGVTAPTKGAQSYDIVRTSVDGDRAVGECHYTTADGVISLRSTWNHTSGTWKAVELENFLS